VAANSTTLSYDVYAFPFAAKRAQVSWRLGNWNRANAGQQRRPIESWPDNRANPMEIERSE